MTRSDSRIGPRHSGRADVGRLLGLALLGVALGGCYPAGRNPVADVPNDYRLRHPIVVQEGDRTFELFIGNNRGGLTPAQRADLLSFAHTWKRDATGGILVEMPIGTPNERATADTLPEIQSILAAGSGLPPHAVNVVAYRPDGPTKLATIRIRYPKMVAEAGPCGTWPDDLGPSYADPGYMMNKPFFNLGCSSQRNLAAMVDNPADLVQPRGETPVYTARRTTVLDKYRKGEPTATVYPDQDKNKISDVGK
jgi:pilus assembly protein CpaD